MMASFNSQRAKIIKDKQMSELTASLFSLRIEGKSDVVLVCDGMEFPAHKLILEASSPYFETMFHSGLEEARSGKVFFTNMESETLVTILDFIYLGEVPKVQTPEQLKETLQVSHMMHLENLYSYCCDVLLSTLCIATFCSIWEVATLYTRNKILEPLLEYMFDNRFEILASNEFLSMSGDQLKEYVLFSATKQLCMNDMLGGVIKWLYVDLPVRTTFAKELMQSIGVELVTQQYISALLKDESIVRTSEEIENSLRAFYTSFLIWMSERKEIRDPATLNCGRANIVFFSDLTGTKGEEEKNEVCNDGWPTYIQQFEIHNMTWLPVQAVGDSLVGAAFSQDGHYIYAAGGKLGSTVIMYNVEKTLVEYAQSYLFKGAVNAGLLIFKNKVHRFGGSTATPRSIIYTNEDKFTTTCTPSYKLTDVHYLRSSPTLLCTRNYVFIVGGNDPEDGLVIEYGCNPDYQNDKVDWKILRIPFFPKMLVSHFFVSKETLHGICFGLDTSVKLKFNESTDRMESTTFSFEPPNKQQVTGVYQFPNSDTTFFVSTLPEGPCIPTYIWEPETDKWTKLPLPKGRYSLPSNGVILNKTYVVGP